MNVDDKNILRVDLTDCYRAAERISVYRSNNIEGGLKSDEISICESDYPLLHEFAMEACSKIADASNYIRTASESGIDALTYDTSEESSYYKDKALGHIPQGIKLEGESMDRGFKDLVLFGLEELEGREFIKYTVLQTYIREAIVHYILMKWYHTIGMFQDRNQENSLFEEALGHLRFNSVVNKKRVNTSRKFRHFG
jgi:hypothetical protein